MLYEIFSIIAPVFICAFIGYSWVRFSHPFDTLFVTRLVSNISTPCLIFSTLMAVDIDTGNFLQMMLAAVINSAVFGLIAWPVFRALNIDLHAFLPSQMFPNAGNMGMSLCMLAFGEEGLALGISYFTVNATLHFTLGNSISSGHISVAGLLRNPVFTTVIITLLMMYFGLSPPAWLFNTTDLLGGIAIPMMLIALGVSLAQFKISSLRLTLSLAAFRLVMGFSVGALLATLLGLEGAARGVLIIQSSMPIAVFAYLFAAKNKRHPDEVAGTVVLSTLMSFLTLPLLLWFVLP